jgi:hypothetical protein
MMSNAYQFGRRTILLRNTFTIRWWLMTVSIPFFVHAGVA